MIRSSTRLIALLGHPVRHSLSPYFQNAALSFLHIDAVYLAFDVRPERLAQALEGLSTLGALGTNLTIPHKEAAIPFIDNLSDEAKRVGAVNTVVFNELSTVGYNTDVQGFRELLKRNRISPEGPIFLLGAGGAAKAVVSALSDKSGIGIACVNRSRERAERFRDWARDQFAMHIDLVRWECFQEGKERFIHRAEGVINATSVGLTGELVKLPWENMASLRWVVDTVYSKGRTPLVKEAQKRKIVAVDGTDMLLFQGAYAFKLFTNKEAPITVMENALLEGGKNNRP